MEGQLLPNEIVLWKGASDHSRPLPWQIRKGQIVTMTVAALALAIGLYQLTQTALQIGGADDQRSVVLFLYAALMAAVIMGTSLLLWSGMTFRAKLAKVLKANLFVVTNIRAFMFDGTKGHVSYEWPLNTLEPRLVGASSVFFPVGRQNPKPHLPGFLMLADATATWLVAHNAWSNNVKAT